MAKNDELGTYEKSLSVKHITSQSHHSWLRLHFQTDTEVAVSAPQKTVANGCAFFLLASIVLCCCDNTTGSHLIHKRLHPLLHR